MFETVDPQRALDLFAGVRVAFALATLVGAERPWRQRSAGLRTDVLVAIGAPAFVSLGQRLNTPRSSTRSARRSSDRR